MAEAQFIESRTEIEEILGQEQLGYLGLLYQGTPYVVPLNYAYRNGRILFHGALGLDVSAALLLAEARGRWIEHDTRCDF